MSKYASHLLQDLPDFLVKADGHSVQRPVQTPPTQPLAVSGILSNRNLVRDVEGFHGRQPEPLNRWEEKSGVTRCNCVYSGRTAPSSCFEAQWHQLTANPHLMQWLMLEGHYRKTEENKQTKTLSKNKKRENKAKLYPRLDAFYVRWLHALRGRE